MKVLLIILFLQPFFCQGQSQPKGDYTFQDIIFSKFQTKTMSFKKFDEGHKQNVKISFLADSIIFYHYHGVTKFAIKSSFNKSDDNTYCFKYELLDSSGKELQLSSSVLKTNPKDIPSILLFFNKDAAGNYKFVQLFRK